MRHGFGGWGGHGHGRGEPSWRDKGWGRDTQSDHSHSSDSWGWGARTWRGDDWDDRAWGGWRGHHDRDPWKDLDDWRKGGCGEDDDDCVDINDLGVVQVELLRDDFGAFAGFDALITVAGESQPRAAQAFCLDVFEDAPAAAPYEATVYDSREDIPDELGLNEENLDLINWILNQDFQSMDAGNGDGETYTQLDVQNAIWVLTDDIAWADEDALEIANLAREEGEGYTPGEGDVVGLIFEGPDETVQPMIIGVDWLC